MPRSTYVRRQGRVLRGLSRRGSPLGAALAPSTQSQDEARYFLSLQSFALPSSIVCHCMLLASSAPPLLSGTMWSTT